ncbi:MAG: molybdopterin-dependent oxidoreductase [Chloroflexi bacterium]|nr:molybdopterin-dependent oxidoreductase [Chloroflexota bacterium]
MAKRQISLMVNGNAYSLEAEPQRSLLRVLREDLELTGTKQGCDYKGECGACTVLLDGKALMACRLPVSRVVGKEVITIEGLGAPDRLHPLQDAFIQCGAVQCGYCTPGIIMQAQALLLANPNPTRGEVVRRLSRNLCRCTGYVKIIDAVLYAAHLMGGGEKRSFRKGDRLVGESVERIDAPKKVCGLAKFAGDLFLPDMLYGKVLRSPYHHALIKGIDTSEAKKLPGVVGVFTAGDIPGVNNLPGARPSAYVFAEDRVRFFGEGVAAVAAETEEVAEAALSKIKVDYQPLPAVFDILEAMKEDAPQLHPKGNVEFAQRVVKGDAEKGFAQADVIVENTYITPHQEHAYLETEAALAHIDEEGRVVTRTPIAHPYRGAEIVAQVLGLAKDRVRVISPPIGGSFGGKGGEFYVASVTSLMAYKLQRPVKVVYTRAESLQASCKRHPYHMRYRTGATKDGKLVAMRAEIIANSGAYPTGLSVMSVPSFAATHATGPYVVPNVFVEAQAVCTNTPKSGSMRGFSCVQIAFAVEAQMDLLAEKLGMDPLEFRLNNAFVIGSETATGQLLDESVGARSTLEALKEPYQRARARLKQDGDTSAIKRGLGICCTWRGYGQQSLAPVESAVELLPDGRVQILTGAGEAGSGTSTILVQMAGDELNLPAGAFHLIGSDTFLAPYPVTTGGSKLTYFCGMAVKRAAADLKKALLQVGSEILETETEKVDLQDGYVVSRADPSQRVPLTRLAAALQAKGMARRFVGSHAWPKFPSVDFETGQGVVTPIYCYASQIAEVEVNVKTGQVRVVRIVHAGDPGTVINPQALEGQVEGGIAMGLGFAIKEKFVTGECQSYRTYPIPTTQDMPDIVSIFVEDPVPTGPYGAKGAGEIPVLAAAAAISNAIANAIGVRVLDPPATPNKIRAALAQKRAN